MRFLAATATRAVSADASMAFDTTPATRRTLAVTLVTRAVAVHAITVFRAVFGVRPSYRQRMEWCL